MEADFLVRIPCSVRAWTGRIGPGGRAPSCNTATDCWGSKGEANGGYLREMADRYGFILFAMDWTGFMEDDRLGITLMLGALDEAHTNASHFGIVSERASQGLVEKVVGLRMMLTDMVDHPDFQHEGQSLIDPDRRYYYGNSQGAIMGAALMGLSPDLTRGAPRCRRRPLFPALAPVRRTLIPSFPS